MLFSFFHCLKYRLHPRHHLITRLQSNLYFRDLLLSDARLSCTLYYNYLARVDGISTKVYTFMQAWANTPKCVTEVQQNN